MKKLLSFCLVSLGLALLAIPSSWATVVSGDKTDPRDGYVDKGVIPHNEWKQIMNNCPLKNVTGIKGDFWGLHTNAPYPWLFQCEWPLEAGANKEGIYNYVYDATAGEYGNGTIVCEFQGKFRGSYMMTAHLTLMQGEDGKSVFARVTHTAYPYNKGYGFDSSNYGAQYGTDYILDLSTQDTAHSGNQVRVSVHNVELEFEAEGETRHVKFIGALLQS